MIINITTYLGSVRTLDTLDTTVWINGDKLTADKDRVSSGILPPQHWFDGLDDCPNKGDEFETVMLKSKTVMLNSSFNSDNFR